MDFRTRRACPTDECRSERGEESLLTQVLWIKQAIPEKMGALEERPLSRKVWESVKYSEENTKDHFLEKLPKDREIKFLKPLREVDIFEDFIALEKEMSKKANLLPQQERLKCWIKQYLKKE